MVVTRPAVMMLRPSEPIEPAHCRRSAQRGAPAHVLSAPGLCEQVCAVIGLTLLPDEELAAIASACQLCA